MDASSRARAGLVVVLLLASLAVIFFRINVSTDLKLFLPEPSNKEERLLHHQLDKGASTNLIFIALSGLAPEPLAEANKQFREELARSPLFRQVINRAAALADEALQFVVDNRYLLSQNDLSSQFTVDGLQEALEARLRGLSSPAAALEKRYLRQDPSGEVLGLLEDWQGKLSKHARPDERHGVWFSRDQQRSLILVEIKSDVTRLENQTAAVQAIRTAYAETAVPALEMVMTGPAAFAVESGEDIRDDVQLLSWLAIVFVTLFLWLVYRSVGMLLLIFAPLLAGIVAATATILVVYGQIHGITLAFGITLAGVAVDYPIHLLTGLTRMQGKDLGYVGKIWPTLRLGVISTVVAYAAFLLSGFGGLQQLGLFTIVGLGTAALFSRWCLPMMLRTRADRRYGLTGVHETLTALAKKLRGARPMVVIAAGFSLLVVVLSDLPILHLNVDSLSPIKEARRDQGRLLRSDLGYWYGGSMLIVTAQDRETVLQGSEDIAPYLDDLIEGQALTGYDMAAQFIPSQRNQQRNIDVFKSPATIQKNLETALDGSRFRPSTFAPFLDEVSGMAATVPLAVTDLPAQNIGRRLEPLLFPFEDGAAGIVLLHGVSDEEEIRRFANRHDSVIYMHLKTSATALVARSVDRVGLVMIGCIAIIYLFLWHGFRSGLRPLKIMVPTLSAAIVTACSLVMFGCPLSIFHLISLMLVVGLGLDYALFFNRLPGNEDEWNTTFKSLWVCATTTILVFGILVLSQTPPLRAIGMTVGIGALLSILFAAMWATVAERPGAARGN